MHKFYKAFQKNRNITTLLLFSITCIAANAQTFLPTADAMVYRSSSATNYGNDARLLLKKTEGAALNRNAYIKFDLGATTPAQVGRAVLRLYCNTKAFEAVQSVVGVFSTSSAWTETGTGSITWANAPALGSFLSSSVAVAKTSYYEWDVTAYVQQSLAGGNVLSLALMDLNSSDNTLEFSSKEATNKPQLVISATPATAQSAYYIDAVDGNDAWDGASASTAWKTLNKLNKTLLSDGAKLYFKSGQVFDGLLNISNNGNSTAAIGIDVFGGIEPVTINGKGQPSAIFVYNRSYVELRNLRVTNFKTGAVPNDDVFNGILFMNENGGVVNHVYMDKVTVDSVNSSSDVDVNRTVFNGGVQFYCAGSAVPSLFNDIKVTNCLFQNLSRTGCNMRSDWELRNLNTTFGQDLGDGRTDNWVPSTNVLFRGNTFRKIAGNGLIVRTADKALVEGNLFDSCGTTISGNACFNFNTDSCVYQFNESKNTIYNNGDTDASGIDSDFRTKHTVVQYNYCHSNGLGGIVATGGEQTSGTIPQRFNIGTTVRYNLLENNTRRGISFSGAMDGMDMYNNTVYADATISDPTIVRVARWGVTPKNLRFKNNIFYFLGANATYEFVSGSTYTFTNNIFFGAHPANEPADPAKITADPKLNAPGTENGYKYLEGSSALGTGMAIANNGGRDYYNIAVSETANPNVGLYNGPGIASAPLPVRLLTFTAKKIANKVGLFWTTASENNTKAFEVERSVDGLAYTKLVSLNAAGTSTQTLAYSCTDVQPANGLNHYRLKQIDNDGKYSYSLVRIVNFNGAKELLLFPNPASDKVSLVLSGAGSDALLIRIFDIEGREVKQVREPANSSLDVNVSELKRGVYLLRLMNAAGNEVIGEARFLKR